MKNSFENEKNLFDSKKAIGKSAKMALKVKQPNTKPRQFELIVEFMEQHTDLAKGVVKGIAAKQTSDQLWKRLAEELNLNGPPTHSFVEWKKIWVDYKNHIKSKLRKNRQNMSGTGGGPSKLCSFTPIEEQVVTLMNLEEAVNDVLKEMNNSQTSSVNFNNLCNATMEEDWESPACNTPSKAGPTTFKASLILPNGKENLLKMQVQNQINYQTDSVEKLSEVCEHLSLCLSERKI